MCEAIKTVAETLTTCYRYSLASLNWQDTPWFVLCMIAVRTVDNTLYDDLRDVYDSLMPRRAIVTRVMSSNVRSRRDRTEI